MRALPLVALSLVACVIVPEGPPPASPEQSFRGVKGIALVHRVPGRGEAEARRRDPLDGLQAALADRGVRTVTLELPERPPEDLAAVDALARELESIADAARPDSRGAAVASVGPRSAPVLERLGVDALVVYARGPGWGAPQPWPFLSQPAVPPPAPQSAMAMAARDGAVVIFTWGGGTGAFGAGPVNAAEAIDAALGLLAPRAE